MVQRAIHCPVHARDKIVVRTGGIFQFSPEKVLSQICGVDDDHEKIPGLAFDEVPGYAHSIGYLPFQKSLILSLAPPDGVHLVQAILAQDIYQAVVRLWWGGQGVIRSGRIEAADHDSLDGFRWIGEGHIDHHASFTGLA